MKITKVDVEKLLREMEKIGIDELEIDIETKHNDDICSIDFDVFASNRHFVKTLLTIEE